MIYCLEELISSPNLPLEIVGNSRVIIKYKTDYLTNSFLYFIRIGRDFLFSFDFFELCERVRDSNINLNPNNKSYPFFIEKGYEPFDSTIVEGIHKVPNLCELVIENGDYYYQLIDLSMYDTDEKGLVIKSICKCFSKDFKNIILFSGGYDSTLLAKVAKDNGIEVELVNGAYSDNLSANDSVEKSYSNRIAKYLGLPYKVVEISQTQFDKNDLDHIVEVQPNTAHYSFIYYSIKKAIGSNNINFISGQQADSILNYGSTSMIKLYKGRIQGIGELVRRYLYMKGNSIHALLFCLLNNLPSRYKQSSMLIGFRKLPIIKDIDIYNSFVYIFEEFLSRVKSPSVVLENNVIFYCMSFLQGSDASGILSLINSTHNPLPFSDYSLIKFYANKNNSLSDIYYPKKTVHELLKEDKTLYSILDKKPNILNISYEIRFAKLVGNLNLLSEYNELARKYSIKGPITFNRYHLVHCLHKIFG